MFKHKLPAFIFYIAIFFLFWNLLGYFIVTFLTHGTFTVTMFGLSIIPTVCALVTGYFIIYRNPSHTRGD